MRFRLVLICGACLGLSVQAQTTVQHGLRVPNGFEVVEYADSKLANDIFHMTIDPKGRVVVAGAGYIRVLVDEKNEGKASKAVEVLSGPKDGAQGMLWEGDWLYYTGDNGLRRVKIADDKPVGQPELIRAIKTGNEHAAHAIRRGPDGWLYLLTGDGAGIDKSYATVKTSPIKEPVGGGVLRFSPDLKESEIVAHGFRNPYDMDFNVAGELFTYDSDNERCVSLPWYAPTQFFHVIPGGNYGWLARVHATFMRLPPYLPDVVPPLEMLGRGSPTGCVCYRHVQFPERYRGAFFLADWTFGRIYHVSLERAGVSYASRKEVFLQAVGEEGFAPTALAIHPKTGDLFVSIGGRGTRGAVYRIRHAESAGKLDADALKRLAIQPRTLVVPPETSERVPLGSATLRALALQKLEQPETTRAAELTAVRMIQKSLGDVCAPSARGLVWEGYTPRLADPSPGVEMARALRKRFPSKHPDASREISRTLAMLEDADPTVLKQVADQLTAVSAPIEDIHYLIVLARLKAPRTESITRQTAAALLSLDAKLDKEQANRDTHWPLRLTEAYTELAKKDPNLNAALLAHADFGRPAHALFAQCPGFDQKKAAAVFLARAAKDANYPWTSDIVKLVGSLPAEQSLPTLRKLWGQAGLEEAILPVLSQHAEAADRDRFLYGLNSPQMATVRVSLDALEKLPEKGADESHVLSLILSLRRLGDTKDEKLLGERLGKYLERLTGQKHAADKKAWADWFAGKYPKLAVRLSGPDGVDVPAWSKRLAKIDWLAGDAERGKLVFTKTNCASCHSGERALGPDLRGITGRFSRDDVLTAIIQPSKDISNRYRTTLIETAEGKVYQGLLIYEAVDSLIIQTGPSTTVRVVNKQIASKRLTDVSLMPAGLLDMLKDEEIGDLYAYLKSLGGAPSEKK